MYAEETEAVWLGPSSLEDPLNLMLGLNKLDIQGEYKLDFLGYNVSYSANQNLVPYLIDL